MKRVHLLPVLLALIGVVVAKPAKIGPPPKKLRLAKFYKKYVDAHGIPIVSSEKVSDAGLFAARDLIDRMLKDRPDVRKALIKHKVRVAVMAPTEVTTDIPEHADLTPKPYWDKRARGLGATAARPATSCGEENLLGLKGDRYRGESILIHEFSHSFHQLGLNEVDKKFEGRLKAAYESAKKKGLWKKTYAISNFIEYWAEGVQCYFDANLQSKEPNGIHNRINTRAELKEYDPALYKLIDKEFRKAQWRWKDPATAKQPDERKSR
ncbi:MAG: hypothetical protein ACYTGZ_15695 [Planctomycetota bacterium]|jgi:hypothetical protein